VPVALLLLGAASLLVGFARPQTSIRVKRQDATVILVLDVSGSMAARDSNPTRLGAARVAAKRYVDKLPKGYRMAVITFSDHTTLSAAPTHDLTLVRAAIDRARTGPQGTALADAVSRAVTVGRSVPATKGKRPPAAIVVFSDGGQTAGRITPEQAAKQAANAHIPVTTVGVGTPDGIVQQQLKGGYTERIQVPIQPTALQAIAKSSGGRYVDGVAAVDVKSTYAELGSRVGHTHKTVEVTSVAAAGGLVFMLAGAFASGLFFRRLV
jgi:Ca-activated chloride channel family protein